MRAAALILVAGLAAPAAAQPAPPRVGLAPAAEILPRDAVHASAAADHRGGTDGEVTASLAGLAQVAIASGGAVRACDPCAGPGRRVQPVWLGAAGLRIGLARDRWFRHQPALALGLDSSFAGWTSDGRLRAARIASLHAAATIALAGLRLHGGVAAWDARARSHGTIHRLGPRLRPLAAAAWTPGRYPRTTVLVDVGWRPELGERPALRWVGGWGLRYQALSWGAIELAVRHRQGDALGDATVAIRLHGVLAGRR